MPGVAGITERPASIHSGQELKTNIKKVAHRSELLMEEQIMKVKDAQDVLQRALLELDLARQPLDLDFHRRRVAELKQKADEAVIILQVVNKMNTELMHGRFNLERALREGSDPNVFRKRVVWLEDRMQQVCWHGKPRAFSRAAQKQIKEQKSAVPSPTKSMQFDLLDKPIVREDTSPRKMDAGYITDYSTAAGTIEPPSLSETDDPAHLPHNKQVRLESAESTDDLRQSKTSLVKRRRKPRADVGKKDSTLERAVLYKSISEPVMQSLPPRSHDQSRGHGAPSRDRSQGQTRGTEASLYPLSVYTGDNVSREPTFISSIRDDSDLKETAELEISREPSFAGSQTRLEELGQGQADTKSRPQTHESSRIDFEISDLKEDQPDVQVSSKDESIDEDDDEETAAQQPVFLTEETLKGPSRGQSRVTFKESEDESLSETESDDGAALYWKSEHHRFDYGQHSLSVLEINPLSYHQMGLAIPGSFVNEPGSKQTDLPWRPTKKGEILDIHRKGLDKLHGKVQKMLMKVHEAAMLSVDSHHYTRDTIQYSPSYLVRNLDVVSSREDTPSSVPALSSRMTSTREGPRPKTQEMSTTSLPPLLKIDKLVEQADDTVTGGKLVYYPKPLLHPQLLPVTKTVKSKTFPRLPQTFGDSDPDKVKPAERIVNQTKLYKDTKMKLYKGKVKARTDHHRLGDFLSPRRRANSDDSYAMSSSRSPDIMKHMAIRSESHDSRNGPSPDEFVGWNAIKPHSGALEHSGLKWERIKDIVHTNVSSSRKDERRDAVQQLGTMEGGDPMVTYALKDRMEKDETDEVKYEAMKSLIKLGCWDEVVMVNIVKHLLVGNYEIRTDLLHTMINGKNVHYVNKDMEIFPVLLELLSHFCKNPDITDSVSFDSAVCLGKLCIADENAKAKLRKVLFNTPDTHLKAQALDILVKQLKCTDRPLIQAALMQLVKSSSWTYRVEASRCLAQIGPRYICMDPVLEGEVYKVLENRIWDEPNREVRFEVARTMTTLGMVSRAQERTIKRLDDHQEEVRSQAVISIGTLGIKNEKTIRILLEMLELDASEYVRLMIIRTFAILGLTDKRVIRTLKEREKLEGSLGRAAARTLSELGAKSQSGLKT